MEESRHGKGISVHHGTMMDSAGVVGSKNGRGLGDKSSRDVQHKGLMVEMSLKAAGLIQKAMK